MMAYNSWGSYMMDWSMDGVVSHRVSHSGSVVSGGGWVVLGVLGGPVIGHVSNISVITVDVVVDVLDPDQLFQFGFSLMTIIRMSTSHREEQRSRNLQRYQLHQRTRQH